MDMTREQFLVGWLMLTSQPWGKPYRDNSQEAQIQLELYWRGVCRTNPYVWQAVCEASASGERWPSLGELKASIHNNSKTEPAGLLERNATLEWQGAPIPISLMFDYQHSHHCTLKEAAFKILPEWLADNPHHEDYVEAAQFLEKAKSNFGVTAKRRGNLRCIP